MTELLAYVASIPAVAVALSLLHAQADGPTPAEPAAAVAAVDPNLASVTGSVTDLAGGPVAGAIIRITVVARSNAARQESAPAPFSALTDADGVFHIEGVTPGAYVPVIYHAKYTLVSDAGQPVMQLPPLTLAAREHKSGYSFSMRAKPVIKGRVTDEDGDPVDDIEVSLVSAGLSGLLTASAADVEVDADGNYTISNIPEGGRYRLRFQPRREYVDPADLPDIHEDVEPVLMETYYPGVEQFSAATEVQFVRGRDLTGLDIRMKKGLRYRVRARLDHGEDVADDNIIAFLVPLDGDQVLPPTMAFVDGTVEFLGVAPGRYMIQTDPFAFKKDEKRERLFVGQETVTVGKRNLEDVKVQVNQLASITVKKVYDPAASPPPAQAGRYAGISLQSVATPWLPPRSSAAKDGLITLDNIIPGDYIFTPNTGEAFKSAKFGGQEVVGNLLHVAPGSNGLLELKVTFKLAQVIGVVRDAQGKPVPNASVILRFMGTGPLRGELARSNAQGEFTVSVLPGRYSVLAGSEEAMSFGLEIDATRVFATRGTMVDVGESGTFTVNPKLLRLEDVR